MTRPARLDRIDLKILTELQRNGGVFFTEEESITSFSQVMASDVDRFRKFYHGMLDAGVYMAPSAFEAGFMSAAHTDDDISATLDAARSVMKTL